MIRNPARVLTALVLFKSTEYLTIANVDRNRAAIVADLDAKTNKNTAGTSGIRQVINVNGEPAVSSLNLSPSFCRVLDAEDAEWGSNFWATLLDPQVCIWSRSSMVSCLEHTFSN